MSKVNIKPLADRVLVEPLEAETKTASGIIIPDTAKEIQLFYPQGHLCKDGSSNKSLTNILLFCQAELRVLHLL